jgi:tight adherence protein B
LLNLIALLAFAAAALAILASRQRPPGAEQQPAQSERATFLEGLERQMRQAGLRWNRMTYYGFLAFGGAIAGLCFAMDRPTEAIFALILAAVSPVLFISRMRAMRQAQIARQLPSSLFLGASVMRAGGTLLQAVDAIAAEMPDPIGAEFKRIQAQMRLQVPAHEAMAEAMERVGVREFAAVVVAARITAEVGGNMAHILDQIARAIMDAQNAARTVQAFTTEGRLSANLLAAMPFLVMGLLQFLSPGYFAPLFSTWPGRILLFLCLGCIGLGYLVIRRMVEIKVT